MLRSLLVAFIVLLLPACVTKISGPLDGVSLADMRQATVIVDEASGHGSGFIVGDSFVVTAKHVAESIGEKSVIRFANGEESPAKMFWQSDDFDVAIIETKVPAGYRPVNFNCKPVVWGEPIAIVGAPSEARWSIKTGIVSSVDELNQEKVPDWVKPTTVVDVAVNPGDSGGPVFGADGRVRGVTVGAFGKGRSMGLMVQSSLICPVVEKALLSGRLTRPTQVARFDK